MKERVSKQAVGVALAVAFGMGGSVSAWAAETPLRAHSFPYSTGDTVVIQNDYGRVRVLGRSSTEVAVRERVLASDRSALENVGVVAQKVGDRVFLQTYFYDYRGQSAEFEIELPPQASVVVWGANPAVEISGMEGPVRVYTQTGSIAASDLTGPGSLLTESGPIALQMRRQPRGDLHLESTRGNVVCQLSPDLNLRGWTRAGGRLLWDRGLELYGGHLEKQVGVGGPLLLASSLRGDVRVDLDFSENVAARPRDFPAAEPVDRTAAGEPDSPSDQGRAGRPEAADPSRPANSPGTSTTTGDYRTNPDGSVSTGYSLKVNVNWTYLNVSVRDAYNNRSLANLRRDDFLVYEDGALQEIEKFDSAEAPFNLLLLLDVSGSTQSFIDLIKEASVRFTRQIKANDAIAVAVFNSDVRLVQPFTNDRSRVENSIRRIRSGGGTAFYDALQTSIHDYMDGLEGRKAIVVFSDGVDNQLTGDWSNGSRTTFNELYRSIQEIDTIIYPIFLDTEDGSPVARGPRRGGGSIIDILTDITRGGGNPSQGDRQAYETARREMQSIADQTGGRLYSPRDIDDLRNAYSEIADDLRVQYRLGYNSNSPKSAGQWRSIEVRVRNFPEARVRTRKGYYGG